MSSENDIVAWLATQHEAMLDELGRMVDTDSGSYDKPGVDAVGAQISAFLARHGVAVASIAGERQGDVLRATVGEPLPPGGGNARANILLMGHRDTVFPAGEAARRPFTVKDGVASGPGVADMKAGLVMNMFLLAAFQKFGGAPGPLVGLFTGDEEIASPEGRPVIEAEARSARVVLNSEPGRPSGAVVTGRKGGVFMIVEIEGRASHAGGNFEAGISAIGELAHKTLSIHALTDLARGITLNVGLVSGGQSVNTIAPAARMEVDFRYVDRAQRDEILGAIEAIVAGGVVPGTSATVPIRREFLPLNATPESERLFELYRDAAGFETAGEFSGGCADSGFTAAMGAPTLCAVGPVGGKAHTVEEFLVVESLVPRAQAAARTICRLAEAGL
jgi:glutamate carboxypeptidase